MVMAAVLDWDDAPLEQSTIEQYIQENAPDQGPGTEQKIERIDELGATILETVPDPQGAAESSTTLWVIRRAGQYIVSVFYCADTGKFDSLELMFRTSADTIVVSLTGASTTRFYVRGASNGLPIGDGS